MFSSQSGDFNFCKNRQNWELNNTEILIQTTWDLNNTEILIQTTFDERCFKGTKNIFKTRKYHSLQNKTH